MSRTGPGARSVQERGARVVPLVPGTHEERARADDVAEPAVVDEAAARLQPPAHERVGRAADPQARGVGDGQELEALRERRGEGLLGVDVLARLQRGKVERRVGVRGREVEDDVDLVVREQLAGRRVRLRQPVLRRLAASLVEVAAGAADHADDVAVAREVGEVDVADVADPHDPDAERVHVLRAPLPGAPGGAPGARCVAATAIRIAWSASRAVHGLGISRRATRRNASSSALYAASNRVEERGPGGTRQRRGVRLQRADRRPPVEADRHRIPRADDLHPDVVAEGVVAGLPEDRERAVGERQDGRARVDVAVLGEHGKPAHRARRVDLGDLLAGHPAQGVEVVDRGVPEQPAGDRDVRVGRRLVVARDQPDEVDRPELAALDQSPRLHVGRVEAPLEADLDDRPGGLRLVDERDRLLEVERERLLDEDRETGVDRPAHERGVGVRRRRHEHRVGRAERLVDGRGDAPADLRRGRRGAIGVDVVDDDLVDARLRRHEPSVQRADPARPEERDPHRVSRRGRRGWAGRCRGSCPAGRGTRPTKPRRVRADAP